MSKTLQTRIQNKHDIKANWDKATNFIPLAGEIIIYDDLNQMKIGNGTTLLSNLPFFNSSSGIYVQATAPENPKDGDIWVDLSDETTYIYAEGESF